MNLSVSCLINLTIIELAMRLSVCVCVCARARVRACVNRLIEQLMSPSPKSQVMFASAFS